MTLSQVRFLWRGTPFIRLLAPFTAGIILEQQFLISRELGWLMLGLTAGCIIAFDRLSAFSGFRFNWLRGIIIQFFLLMTGYLITVANEGRRDRDFILHHLSSASKTLITLQEPLQEKPNSFKALATVDQLLNNDSLLPVSGKMVVYFSKKENTSKLGYGTRLLISKSFHEIQNAANPGGFDYKAFCYRNDIFFTVFLSQKEFTVLEKKSANLFKSAIFNMRSAVLNIISNFIHGKKESGFAKALLIGYTDELDKQLVQSYTNTGVVHIIAISGLHLGIIFTLLNFLVVPLRKNKMSRFIAALVVIAGLWLFSVLAGAGPSVLRSAFMFSFMVVGGLLSRRSNVLNNLFASAFILLCIHPFWFWDVGFRLSYAAVLSILLFFKPIYSWFYFPNKFVDFIWKLNAVTLSAQVLTIPLCIYHFHQFPVYFLFSNLLAVPWSSVILLGEILLCCVAFLPSIAMMIGHILKWLIYGLNNYIEHVNSLPASTWAPLEISTLQLLLLFSFIALVSSFLVNKNNTAFILVFLILFALVGLRSYAFIQTDRQKKIIVYNLPKSSGIDFINGRKAFFLGRGGNNATNNFYVSPARRMLRALPDASPNYLLQSKHLIWFSGKFVLLANSSIKVPLYSIPIDLLVLSNNSKIDLSLMIERVHPVTVISDASNQTLMIRKWKNICEAMKIAFHDVSEDGAFQYDLN